VSFAFLFLLMFGLFAFIITGLYRFGLIEIPAFIQELFFKAGKEEPEAEKNDKNIYDHLKKIPGEANGGGGGFVLEITLENAREAIAGTKLPENLHLETEAHYYTDGKITRTEKMTLWKKGGKYRYLLSVDSVLVESYTNDTRDELIENHSTGSRLKREAAPSFSLGSIPHMPDINHYLDLTGGGEIKNYIIRQDDENIIEIRYDLPQMDQYELIHISLDTGIVLWVRSFALTHGGQFYECKTKVNAAYYSGAEQSVASVASIDDTLFLIPDS